MPGSLRTEAEVLEHPLWHEWRKSIETTRVTAHTMTILWKNLHAIGENILVYMGNGEESALGQTQTAHLLTVSRVIKLIDETICCFNGRNV